MTKLDAQIDAAETEFFAHLADVDFRLQSFHDEYARKKSLAATLERVEEATDAMHEALRWADRAAELEKAREAMK